MDTTKNINTYSRQQLTLLVILRVLIGWHLLYEGIVKLWNPDWSAAGYLRDSKGIFAGMFEAMTHNTALMNALDFLTIWGLILIGLSMISGLLTRWAMIAGIILLSMFYLSHPPLIGAQYALPSEGSYLWVNKNLIEIFAVAVLLAFPTSKIIGLDALFAKRRSEQTDNNQATAPVATEDAAVA